MKVLLLYVGKRRDANLNAFAEEFIKRASRFLSCEMREINPRRYDPFSKNPNAVTVLLDPSGDPQGSKAFVKLVTDCTAAGRDLLFLVGGHDGLPPEWTSRGDHYLSLSPLTFPHELARAIVAEQIYRALATLNNHPYPR